MRKIVNKKIVASAFLALGFSCASMVARADDAWIGAKHTHHLDLELSGAEYEALMAGKNFAKGPLDPVVNMGARNLAWLRHINSRRAPDQQLSFTSAATQTGIPITAPKVYNETIVLQDYQNLIAAMPEIIRNVVIHNQAFTDDLPLAEADYLEWGRKIDKVYGSANRWKMMSPYIPYLTGRKRMDVRGYYFLRQEPDLNTKLANWNSLPDADKVRLRPWLIGLCENGSMTNLDCRRTLTRAENSDGVSAFYARHLPNGEARWKEFFSLDVRRNDVRWTTNPLELRIPFLDPRDAQIRAYLGNIEDEWRWNNWQLRLDFQAGGDIPRVVFQPGVTPNVNRLGGNIITMDSNQPLTEYDSQWTIRHEFGHVLGFEDCYVEFYDSGLSAIVNYQIDVENLMCSRRGKLQELHFLELARTYQRPAI